MVHVSVHQRLEPSHLAGIRPLEDELGRALRARDWTAFDLAYGRLIALQNDDALSHWQAARAMAEGDHEQAMQLLEHLHRDNPFDLRTGLNLALVHEAQGEIEKARNIVRTLSRRHSLDSGLQALLDRLENTQVR
jgi:Flp pilus assembly protein TadD